MSNERWQYQVAEVKSGLFGVKAADAQEQLNKLGMQGWELVAVRHVSTSLQLFLKRRM